MMICCIRAQWSKHGPKSATGWHAERVAVGLAQSEVQWPTASFYEEA